MPGTHFSFDDSETRKWKIKINRRRHCRLADDECFKNRYCSETKELLISANDNNSFILLFHCPIGDAVHSRWDNKTHTYLVCICLTLRCCIQWGCKPVPGLIRALVLCLSLFKNYLLNIIINLSVQVGTRRAIKWTFFETHLMWKFKRRSSSVRLSRVSEPTDSQWRVSSVLFSHIDSAFGIYFAFFFLSHIIFSRRRWKIATVSTQLLHGMCTETEAVR